MQIHKKNNEQSIVLFTLKQFLLHPPATGSLIYNPARTCLAHFLAGPGCRDLMALSSTVAGHQTFMDSPRPDRSSPDRISNGVPGHFSAPIKFALCLRGGGLFLLLRALIYRRRGCSGSFDGRT
ncbi:hypothetical protein JTE90_028328 [Oedothorax gibbosus]|uniref:Uncharacterized protein n=1 Tax=Oedothorax gibbosus TaxID=931172 RepID=A0AAV6V5A5_9ARAC|nr:hypothetical protein JTE90_028328 [Oedothorax gibbosus]